MNGFEVFTGKFVGEPEKRLILKLDLYISIYRKMVSTELTRSRWLSAFSFVVVNSAISTIQFVLKHHEKCLAVNDFKEALDCVMVTNHHDTSQMERIEYYDGESQHINSCDSMEGLSLS